MSKPLSKIQRAALEFARDDRGLRNGSIEQSLELGISGAALETVIKSLEKRGLVAGEDGYATPAGEALLVELDVADKARKETV